MDRRFEWSGRCGESQVTWSGRDKFWCKNFEFQDALETLSTVKKEENNLSQRPKGIAHRTGKMWKRWKNVKTDKMETELIDTKCKRKFPMTGSTD